MNVAHLPEHGADSYSLLLNFPEVILKSTEVVYKLQSTPVCYIPMSKKTVSLLREVQTFLHFKLEM